MFAMRRQNHKCSTLPLCQFCGEGSGILAWLSLFFSRVGVQLPPVMLILAVLETISMINLIDVSVKKHSTGGMPMLLTLVNGLLGAICGTWFRVQILFPLIALACAEVVFLKHTGTWWSTFGYAMMLIVAVEIGYLAGAWAVALWLSSSRRTMSDEFSNMDRLWSR